ncbi:MAG: hypothetical protein IKI29_05205 [Clostridia bacterium]|nr:hypothetical protein [Clostridia bacterium]
MNNMKYYQGSLAYDYDLFMPKKEQPADNIIALKKVQPKKRTRAAARPLNLTAFAVVTSFVIVAAMCGNIFLHLQINEVNTKINQVEAELKLLESEKTSLQVQLESKLSYTNVEREASELGMRKMNKEQVKYIRVNDADVALNANGEIPSVKKGK